MSPHPFVTAAQLRANPIDVVGEKITGDSKVPVGEPDVAKLSAVAERNGLTAAA